MQRISNLYNSYLPTWVNEYIEPITKKISNFVIAIFEKIQKIFSTHTQKKEEPCSLKVTIPINHPSDLMSPRSPIASNNARFNSDSTVENLRMSSLESFGSVVSEEADDQMPVSQTVTSSEILLSIRSDLKELIDLDTNEKTKNKTQETDFHHGLRKDSTGSSYSPIKRDDIFSDNSLITSLTQEQSDLVRQIFREKSSLQRSFSGKARGFLEASNRQDLYDQVENPAATLAYIISTKDLFKQLTESRHHWNRFKEILDLQLNAIKDPRVFEDTGLMYSTLLKNSCPKNQEKIEKEIAEIFKKDLKGSALFEFVKNCA